MKNIAVSDFLTYSLKDQTVDVFVCHQRTLFVYGNGKVTKYELESVDIIKTSTICEIGEVYPLENPSVFPTAVNLTYWGDNDTLYLCLADGAIVSVEAKSGNSDVVGSIDGGIRSVAWSPGEEVIVFISGTDSVIVMTNDFDVLAEVPLHAEGFGENQFMTVGWGKKETQFRGTEGKMTKGKAAPVPQTPCYDDGKVRISWRGDAKYFAVSCTNPASGLRYIRIFDKEGVLQYTSEDLVGLESPISWQPNGSLITTTQRLPNKHLVIFVEKNGLAHGNFTLPFKNDQVVVKEVAWSPDSKLLALHVEEIKDSSVLSGPVEAKTEVVETSGKKCEDCKCIGKTEESNLFKEAEGNVNLAVKKVIQIYTMKNYHWYLKYSIDLSVADEGILMEWDSQQDGVLHVVYKEGVRVHYSCYTWLWSLAKTRGTELTDEAMVGVIDGAKVLVTAFRAGIVPPPMSSYAIELPHPANAIGFLEPGEQQDASSNDLFVQLTTGEVQLYKFVKTKEPEDTLYTMKHELAGSFRSDANDSTFVYNLHWLNKATMIYCQVKEDVDKPSKAFLTVMNIDTKSEASLKIDATVSLVATLSGTNDVFVHDNAGKMSVVTLSEGHSLTDSKGTDLSPKERVAIADMAVKQKGDGSYMIFCLDKSNRFFVNSTMLANNVTSFAVHEEYLLLTSLKHELLCLHIETELSLGREGCGELKDVSSRRIERGARLVRTVPKDTKVILQMPRGNLECIQPRALSFFIIGQLLDLQQYHKAFDIMRKERINLNVLYDHNQKLFSSNVDHFLREVGDPSWISLFISDLVPDNVTETMYSVFYKRRTSAVTKVENKVDVVCALVESALEKKEGYLLPIVTCNVKRGQLMYLEKALTIIKSVKDMEANGKIPAVSSDAALKYILYLVNVEDLYNVALGMYDFDLVLLVAGKSQKDPKEYIPFLNDLRKMDAHYQHFTIDQHLKRYEKALQSIVLCEGDEVLKECMKFIRRHNLYKQAIKLFPARSPKHVQVCDMYGEELLKGNLNEEAGMIYSSCGMWKEAVEAYLKCGAWQEVIYCSQQMQRDEGKLQKLYRSLAADLIGRKQFKEAATVQMDYLNDAESSLSTLCLGKHFNEAYRIAHLHDRQSAVEEQLRPAVLEYVEQLKVQITSYHDLFLTQKTRLATVRVLKTQKPPDTDLGAGDGFRGEQDLYSDASTVASTYTGTQSTARSFRSSKNRRKQERKLLSLKEGSPFEDLALIASLHGIATNSYELRTEVRDLNRCLMKMGEQGGAETLQRLLADLLCDVDKSKSDIWSTQILQSGFGPEATSNSIAAMFQKQEGGLPPTLLQPHLIFPPNPHNVKWKLDILD